MLYFATFFILLSSIGFLGMTFLPIILSGLLYQMRKKKYPTLLTSEDCKIEILIPVHNQPEALEATLLNLSNFNIPFNISVGLNACNDSTAIIAQKYKCNLITKTEPGKWGMLKDLILRANGDWLLLLDAGTLLPPDFFLKLKLHQVESHIMGIAPRYYPHRLGILQKVIWIFESLHKKLENIAGGPMSVHGACIIYQKMKLIEVVKSLGENTWLNDDIVLPLWMRFLNPDDKIIYRFDVCIDDFDVHTAPPSPHRRKRLVQGNLDWISTLLPIIYKKDVPLFILSSRRVFRVLWAWWPICFYLSIQFFIAHYSIKISLIFLAISAFIFYFIIMTKKSELPAAFISSVFFFKGRTKSYWK